jgi:hypothetical protein
MEEVLHSATDRLDEVASVIDRKTNQVDNHIGLQRTNLLPPLASRFRRGAIHRDLLHPLPRGVGQVRRALRTRNHQHIVPSRNQAGNQKGANMSSATNDHNAHMSLPRMTK